LLPSWFAQSSEKPDERAGTGFFPNSAEEQGLFGGVVGKFEILFSSLLYTRKDSVLALLGERLQYGGS